LAAVIAAAVAARGPALKEAWLERQTADSLGKAAAAANPDPLALLVYARKLLRANKMEEAVAALTKAEQELRPGDKSKLAQRIASLKGYLLARAGDSDHAIPYLSAASEMNPDDPLPHVGFGILFSQRQMPKFAIPQFELATQLDPENVEAWYRLGKAAIENLKAQQAIAPLKKAVSLAPNDAASHAELGIAYAVQSQFAEAVPHFRKAMELSDDKNEYMALLANALAMKARTDSEYEEAAALLKKAREVRPDDDNMLLTEGLLHLRFNALDEARKSLKQSVRIAPKNASAWYNLSVVEQRQGNDAAYESARSRFQTLTDIHTNTVNMEKSVSASPRNPDLRLKLSSAYRQGGNMTGSYWQLKIASELKPEDAGIRKSLEALQRNLPASMTSSVSLSTVEGETAGPPPPEDMALKGLSGNAARPAAP
jgi:tetratricopeptide (TPR) repeat protein